MQPQVRAEPPSPREAQLAQRLAALGLLSADQLQRLWLRRTQGDARPLEQVLLQERLVAPDALARALAGLTQPEARQPTLALQDSSRDHRPPTAREPDSSFTGSAVRTRDQGDSGGRYDPRTAAVPGSDPLASVGLSSSVRVKTGAVVQLTPELHVTCERLLGQGGMGTVHLVHDPTLGRRAALKLVKGEGSATRTKRFKREVVVTARLDHPGIPPVFLSGRTPAGQDFLLMRFVDGDALDKVLDNVHDRADGRLRSREAKPAPEARDLLDALVKVSEAMAYAHSRGIVHRDLKPANIMIGAFGEVLLMDWGLARDLAESSQEDQAVRHELATLLEDTKGLTQDGALLGTPGYMAPEQARGHDVDARADVFALGAVLVEVLTGEPPVTGQTTLEVLAKTGQGDVTLPRERRPDVAPELNAIAARALARDPGRRYDGAAEFGADLKAYLEGRAVSVYRYGRLEQLRRLARRHPAALAGLVATFALSLGGVIAVGQARTGAAAAERRAAVDRARAASDEARAAVSAGGTDDTDRAIGLSLAALQAAQRWRVLAPDDATAARAQHEAAARLGELAERAEQWSLALEAFRQAGGLGVDDAGAAVAIARVEAARHAEAERRRAEVAGLLEQARTGALSRRAEGLQDAVFKIARFSDPAIVAQLRAALDQVSERLRAVTRNFYVSAAEPDPDERSASGERAIDGLAAAIDARLSLGFAGEPDAAQRAALAQAERRLERRAERARSRNATRPTAQVLLSSRQAAEVGGGDLDVARLACEALGRIGDPGAVPSITAYLAAEADQLRAIPAAAALLRLGGTSAQRTVMAARARFGRASAFNYRIDELLSWLDDAAAPSIEAETAAAYFQRGDWHEARKDADAATADFTRAIELDPRHAEAYSRRGNVRIDSDTRAALADYDRAVSLAPQEPRYLANRANARTRLNDLAGAIADYDRALELDPMNGGMFMNRALARGQLGDRAGARADLDRAIELEPDSVYAWVNRGLERTETGDHAGARADFDHAIALDPREINAYLARGMFLQKQGELDLAQADFDLAAALAPADARCFELRGDVRADRGDLDGALEDLSRALELSGKNPRAWKARAEVKLRMRDRRGALDDLDRALALDPSWAPALNLRAEVLGDVDPARAREEADRLIESGAGDARALIARGRARLQQGDLRGAIADHQRACELDPRSARAWYGLGACLTQAGDNEAAMAAFERSLELEPRQAHVLSDRAVVKQNTGDLQGAADDLTRALELDPGNAVAWTNRAVMRRELGDAAGARADVDQALALDPAYPAAWANRALLRMQAGDLRGAQDDLTRAIELAPDAAVPWEFRAAVKEQLGDQAGARADVERALKLDDTSAMSWFIKAKLAMTARNYREAADCATRSLRGPGASPGALLVRGSAREALGDLPGAIEDVTRFLEVTPADDPDAAKARELLEKLKARRR
jgi:tetratricopeptide (TPR) repeat protein/tRNA A-37 threonylcarbamoyl transferase component Bud32